MQVSGGGDLIHYKKNVYAPTKVTENLFLRKGNDIFPRIFREHKHFLGVWSESSETKVSSVISRNIFSEVYRENVITDNNTNLSLQFQKQ